MAQVTFFENQTTNATSSEVLGTALTGGFCVMKFTGTFDGAIIKVMMDFNDSDYAPLDALEIDEACCRAVKMPAGTRITVELSNAQPTTDITVKGTRSE